MQLFGNAGCCSTPPFPFAFPRVVSGHSPSWCARSYHGARSSCGSTRITKAHGRLGRLGLQSQHRRLHRPQEVSKLLTFSIWLQRKAAFWPQRGQCLSVWPPMPVQRPKMSEVAAGLRHKKHPALIPQPQLPPSTKEGCLHPALTHVPRSQGKRVRPRV